MGFYKDDERYYDEETYKNYLEKKEQFMEKTKEALKNLFRR
ncbi:hypothetical protein [Caloramator proteoclasticus]|uniref:Uncharacterized protein n=1 Tax=Caloramator proteoclasticus DSM 10124 TaxID=1121262 RepID=A0A1M5A302_9CLOT|nr:hypothetical protein [Caloramator proteoclasticus]SHF24658.1 hypothetical protein SAMN02746091_02084 [Caloramator proteoclasticus DSM 10124]